LFEIRSDKRATFVCLGFKLWKANPVSFNLSIQCSKEVVCIEDLGELIDTFLFLLARDPDAAENSASAKRLQHLYGCTQVLKLFPESLAGFAASPDFLYLSRPDGVAAVLSPSPRRAR
jgi:hypothetical protein